MTTLVIAGMSISLWIAGVAEPQLRTLSAFALECEGQCNQVQQQIVNDPPDGRGLAANGAHRGAASQAILTSLHSILLNNTDLSREEISEKLTGPFALTSVEPEPDNTYLVTPPHFELQIVICKALKLANAHDDYKESKHFIAVVIADVFNVDVAPVYTAIKHEGFCDGVLEVRRTETFAQAKRKGVKKIALGNPILVVDAEGVPVSSDPIWNACIRDTIVLDHSGRPFRCNRDHYHSGNKWYHPDIDHFSFTWNTRRKLFYDLAENVKLVQVDSMDSAVLLARVGEVYTL